MTSLARRFVLSLLLLLPGLLAADDHRWTHLGPFGGTVLEIVVAPTAHRTLYAAVDYRVYRSDDAGGRWRLAHKGLPPGVSALAVDPSDARTVYAGLGVIQREGATSLYKTVDGGASWLPLSGVSGQQVSDIAVDPHDPSRLLVAGTTSLFRSVDGGATWDRPGLPAGGPLAPLCENVAFDPSTPGIAYAAVGNRGFLKSVDGGVTWMKKNQGLPFPSLARLAVSPSGTLAAVPAGQTAVFRSLDQGETWSLLGPVGTSIFALAFSSDGAALLAGTDLGLFRKDDTGPGWTRLRPSHPEQILTIAADPVEDGTFYAGIGYYGGFRGVLRSADTGATWSPANRGLGGVAVIAAATAPSNPRVIYASFEPLVLARSTDGGATWRQVDPQLDRAIRKLVVDPRNPDVVSGVGEYGLFVRSTDGGRSWTHSQIEDGGCVFPFSLSLDPRHPDILFLAGGQALACQRAQEDSCHTLATTDGGEAWDCLEGARSNSFSSVAADPRRPSTLYAIENDFFKSTDGGRTWNRSGRGLPDTVLSALAVASDGTLWVGSGFGLFRSGDGGATWRRSARGLPADANIGQIVIAPSNPSILYLSISIYNVQTGTSSYDFYVSTNRGSSWRRLPENGLPGTTYPRYWPLLVDPRDAGRIYLGRPLGLYRLDRALD